MTLNDFNTEYRNALKAFTASSGTLANDVLTLTETVYTAQQTLTTRDFLLFRRHNSLGVPGQKDSRLAAFLKIGQAAKHLRPFAAQLPASITALLHLARVAPDTVTEQIASGNIHPLMTAMEAQHLVVTTTRPRTSKRRQNYYLKIDFITADFDALSARQFIVALDSYLKKNTDRFHVDPNVTMSPDLERRLTSTPRRSKEAA